MTGITSDARSKKRNPEAVKADILRIATEEFAGSGYAGARVNVIAERTNTSKRMIYYYFGDKENLYREVLENSYRAIRIGESLLDLEHLSPDEAMRTLIAFTFEHQKKNTDFVRLTMIENIHNGAHLGDEDEFRRINAPAIERVESIYHRGVAEGVFKSRITPVRLHWIISSMCFFNSSNRVTFSAAFGEEVFTDEVQKLLCEEIQDAIMSLLLRKTD